MLNIISNGSHFAGSGPSPLESLEEALQSEPLDRSFEAFGNFVISPTLELDKVVRFFGNFFGVSHVFSIDTDEPEVIERLTALIRTNQKRPDYLSQHNPYGSKVRTLECCCCGESTRGRQWWNRDTGYGMCPKCIAWLRGRGTPEAEIRDLYGVEGVHWGVDESAGLREELGNALAGEACNTSGCD